MLPVVCPLFFKWVLHRNPREDGARAARNRPKRGYPTGRREEKIDQVTGGSVVSSGAHCLLPDHCTY